MSKVQKSEPDLPSRSDSFLRMLELEKRYKMQRIQGHAPATITSPSASSPSAQPDKPFKARRASGHPPLSHQTQIMKAVRRSSALPSLSISIPPSPTESPVVGANGLPGELQSKKEERTKTVTFSDLEDDDGDSSDQSSICQSPSWEQYDRKKTKKPKKRDAGQGKKSKEDKLASIIKKRGNKLSKVPPPHAQGVEPLVSTNRAHSAPELDLYLKSNATHLDTPDQVSSGAMANPKIDPKPKSKGFLSGFRLQHGNVAAVQKIIEGQRMSSDGDPPHPTGSGAEPNFINPRKPPSVRSGASNSTRSISSLDQLPPSARHSSNSSHGRSQSLLSSTLSKLKGPSYLYYRPGEVPDGAQRQRPSSSQEHEIASNWLHDQPPKRPAEQQPERIKEQLVSSKESTQPLPEFTFPPKSKRVTTHSTPDVAARNVQDQAHPEDSRELNNEYESAEPTSFRSRRNHMPPPRAPSREPAIEKEKPPRPGRPSRAPRQPIEFSDENLPPQSRQPVREVEHRQHVGRQVNSYVQPHVESWVESKHEPESTPPSHYHVTGPDNEKLYQSDANPSRDEEDRVSVGTYASTIRPVSRRQGRGSPGTDGRKHVTFPSSPNTIGRAVTSDPVDEEAQPKATKPLRPEERDEVEEITPIRKPARSERSGDYFSFISQSYAPPTLELRSPMEGKFPSPRIDEEPEDDNDLDHILRHIPVRSQVNEVATPSESSNHTTASNSSRFARQKPPKNSPSLSSHYSDSDVPALERLGISPKAARILAGTETSSTSTSQSNTDPSRSNSERSSSSTCDDSPPSPATAPTPDISHPQSHKEPALPRADATNSGVARSNADGEEKTPRGTYRAPAMELPAKQTSRSASRDSKIRDDSWSRTALPIDLDGHVSSDKIGGLSSSPSLVATPTSATFAEDNKGSVSEEEPINRNPYPQPIAPRAYSALDIHSTSFSPDLKQQNLHQRKAKGGLSSISLPSSPPPGLVDGNLRKPALRTSRKSSSSNEESAALVSPGAAYLQEARKTVPVPPTSSSSRALRSHYAHKNSPNSIKSIIGPDGRSDPLAKMLVECCNCKFFHDMPSRVYECMAKPDSLVEDKLLGVSATITTMVKCPWCAHGMTTQCCSGYAAVVYLKEKLHGK